MAMLGGKQLRRTGQDDWMATVGRVVGLLALTGNR